jgi:hypothetical protein
LTELEALLEVAGVLIGDFGMSLDAYLNEYSPDGGRRLQKFEVNALKRILLFFGNGLPFFGSVADVLTIMGGILPKEDRFEQLDARFDEVIEKLDQIEARFSQKFEEMVLLFAMEDIEETSEDLHSLIHKRDQFMHPDHTDTTRQVYHVAFRQACLSGRYSPYDIAMNFYKHACTTCEKFTGKMSYLDTQNRVIEMAAAKFPDNENGRIWFYRNEYSYPLVVGIIQVIFLHIQCPYQNSGICHTDDPAWISTFTLLQSVLEEMAESVAQGETRLLESPMPSASPSQAPVEAPSRPCPLGRGKFCRGKHPSN